MIFGVLRHFLDLLGEVDERFVLYSRATWTTDDVQCFVVELHDAANSSRVNVADDPQTRINLFRLTIIGQRQ